MYMEKVKQKKPWRFPENLSLGGWHLLWALTVLIHTFSHLGRFSEVWHCTGVATCFLAGLEWGQIKLESACKTLCRHSFWCVPEPDVALSRIRNMEQQVSWHLAVQMVPQIEHWFLSKISISFFELHLFWVCLSNSWMFSSQFAFAYSKYIVSCMDMHENSLFAGGNELILMSGNNEKNEESQRSRYCCVKCLVNKTKK